MENNEENMAMLKEHLLSGGLVGGLPMYVEFAIFDESGDMHTTGDIEGLSAYRVVPGDYVQVRVVTEWCSEIIIHTGEEDDEQF